MSNNGSSAGNGARGVRARRDWPARRWRCSTHRRRGEETRRKLAEKAHEGRDKAESVAREGREFFNRQRDNLTAAVERGREAFDQARKETL